MQLSEYDQGEAYLQGTNVGSVSLLEELRDAADATLVSRAAVALGAQLQKLPAMGATGRAVQQLLMAVMDSMSDSHAGLLRLQPCDRVPLVVWDTHSKVLAVSSRSIWAEPDVLLCDRFETAANVVSLVEVTRKLASRPLEVQGAFQIAQRLNQLWPYQRSRESWWAGLIGADYVDIWHIQGNCRRRTGHLSLAPEPHSEGLQALARLYCSDKQQLGYEPPAVPAPVMLSPPSERLATFLARLTIEHGSSNMSAAEVWRCTTIDSAGSSIVLKSSREVNIEINAIAIVNDFVPAIPHMPTLLGMGFTGDGRMWLAMPDHGNPFACLRDPASVVAATKQAATGLKGLHDNGYLHGDISPYSIAVSLAEDGTTATTLIDLATLRPLRDPKMPVHLVTGTPDFMAVEVLEGAAQAASSDLESLMYCFLHVATQGRLPWKDLPRHTRAPAIYAKYSCMAKKSLYHSKITAHIREPSLVPIAKSLRGLFFRDDKYEPMVSASDFIAALETLP